MLDLPSIVNFRDIGGHPTRDGARVRRGVVFRSGHLSAISEEDLDKLERHGLRSVIDFRSGADVSEDGGVQLPGGARRIHLPMGDPARAPTDLRQLLLRGEREELERHLGDGQAAGIMRNAAEALVLEQREGYGGMIRHLAQPDGVPAIVHCSAGKDRTGWAASLLLLIAGVPDDAIVAHYVESDVHRAEVSQRQMARVPEEMREWLRPFFECRPEYAETALAAMRREYGDVETYVVRGLGVAAGDLARLRGHLLES